MKELWCYQDDRIAVRFEYEYHDQNGQWFRAHGNELWVVRLGIVRAGDTINIFVKVAFSPLSVQFFQFDDHGLMKRRDASINDFPIEEAERKYK